MRATPRSSMYYGGQAVVEGVMIRGPREMAIAVRAPDGRIITRSERLSGVYTGPLRRLPVVRGMIVLYETLALGLSALTWSSQVATGRDEEESAARTPAAPLNRERWGSGAHPPAEDPALDRRPPSLGPHRSPDRRSDSPVSPPRSAA